MNNSHIFSLTTTSLGTVLLLAVTVSNSQAFETYSGCTTCHGDFRGPTSTKGTVFPNDKNHDMHRSGANMNTECTLCHTSPNRSPVYIGSSDGTANNPGWGCTGCHVESGLRKHHLSNEVNCYTGCHNSNETSPAEGVKPRYYGTADTKVDNPCNDVLMADTNENWSIGDLLGVDNDGDNLYDLADFDCGPPYRLVSATPEGGDVRITWETVGGRTDAVQASGNIDGTYSDVSSTITNAGVGVMTNDYVEVGGATNTARFYRVRYAP